ncbi:hypothetical protein ACA910_000542 [Epithemia clementina (nom. ined.)]
MVTSMMGTEGSAPTPAVSSSGAIVLLPSLHQLPQHSLPATTTTTTTTTITTAVSSSSPGAPPPETSVVHGSLVGVQCVFGAGGVIAALGLPACNPFAFALYREVAAGAILITAATVITSSKRGGRCQSGASSGGDDDNDKESKEPLLLPSPPSLGQLTAVVATTPDPKTGKPPPILSSLRTMLRKKYAWLPWHFPGTTSELGSMLRLVVLGLMIFCNQVFFIIGIKLAGPVSCAVWQPSQPIITAAISMMSGREPFRVVRVLGVLIAFAGCTIMVVLSQQEKTALASTVDNSHVDDGIRALLSSSYYSENRRTAGAAVPTDNENLHPNIGSSLLGNCFFFINCLCTSLYVILSKPAMRIYPALFVTAWSYNVAAAIMGVTAFLAAQSPQIMNLVCPECPSYWIIPSGAYFALSYYIMFNSVLAYAILTWANQFATGTLVMGYSVLQPVTAATLTVVLLMLHVFPSCVDLAKNHSSSSTPQACLEQPGMGTLIGMMGVFLGLFFVVNTEPSSSNSATAAGVVAAHANNSNSSIGRLKREEDEENEGVALTSIQKRVPSKRP